MIPYSTSKTILEGLTSVQHLNKQWNASAIATIDGQGLTDFRMQSAASNPEGSLKSQADWMNMAHSVLHETSTGLIIYWIY